MNKQDNKDHYNVLIDEKNKILYHENKSNKGKCIKTGLVILLIGAIAGGSVAGYFAYKHTH